MIEHRDHSFKPYIPASQIQNRVAELGEQLGRDYADQNPILLGVLNGAFMFTADLMRAITTPTEVAFVRYASYEGTASTGKVRQLLGLPDNLAGRHVIVVEDIVDSGLTMEKILSQLAELNPASVAVATCLLKPDALQVALDLKYVGFEIPNDFVIGYGLDFDEFGRHLPDIYRLAED